ncbi:DUF4087 domain-containing protein [Tabrizicola sp.]|uniref:DUF4087 domain-containing protein n=1 Tax=Tabrizicola sp. TaxID=2005166 RepID=UPI003F3D60C1
MRLKTLTLIASLATPTFATAETRCGWYDNPTPGNVFFDDADGSWTISTQGGPEALGFGDAYTTNFDDRERVVTNAGSYGYSCACVHGKFGPVGSGEVLKVTRLEGLPLSQCVNDPKLPPPPG